MSNIDNKILRVKFLLDREEAQRIRDVNSINKTKLRMQVKSRGGNKKEYKKQKQGLEDEIEYLTLSTYETEEKIDELSSVLEEYLILKEKEDNAIILEKDIEKERIATLSWVESNNKDYDVFISHASDDKEEFVRPLAEELRNNNIKVWYDEFELQLGDSLRKKIDLGLKNSKFGLVILSTAFFNRPWTDYELNGFLAREMNSMKVILPIWHKISKDEVLRFSPPLADKVALKSSDMSVNEIASEIAKVLN